MEVNYDSYYRSRGFFGSECIVNTFSEAVHSERKSVSEFLAEYVREMGERAVGESGYSVFGAVVGATFPKETKKLRQIMRRNNFLVHGYGAQGGCAEDIVSCLTRMV